MIQDERAVKFDFHTGLTVIRRASSVFKLRIPLSKRSVRRSSFVSSVFCSGVIDAERRRWRAPEKLRLIAAISSRVLRLSCGPAYRAVIACARRCGRISNFQSQSCVADRRRAAVGGSGRCSLTQINAKRMLAPVSDCI